MKESNSQLLASVDTAGLVSDGSSQENKNEAAGSQQFGSFVALRRLSKVQVEAVRMQGCADGAGAGE